MAVKGLNFNLGARVTGQSAFTSFQRALNAITAAGNSAKTSMRGVSGEVDRFGNAVRAVTRETSMFEGEFQRLQAKFNPAAAALQRLAQTEEELTRAMRIGAISVESYEQQLSELKRQMDTASVAGNRFSQITRNAISPVNANRNAMTSWNRGLSDNRRAFQNIGFQVSDFAVQIAGGQSAMLAFVQQDGQVLQFFGVWGAVLAGFLTVFGTIAIVMIKTGGALENISSLGGVLSGVFGAIFSGIGKIGSALLPVINAILSNMDLILIAGGIVATFMATRWVFAWLMATTAVRAFLFSLALVGPMQTLAIVGTSLFTAAIGALTVALNLLPLVALVVGAALLVKWFLQLARGAGGFGSALGLLAEVGREVFDRIKISMSLLIPAASYAAGGIKMAFASMWNGLMADAMGPINWLRESLLDLDDLLNGPGKGRGASVNLSYTPIDVSGIASGMRLDAAEMSSIAEQITAPLQSVIDMMAAFNKGAADPVDISDWFSGGDEGKGRGSEAMSKIAKLAEDYAKLVKSLDPAVLATRAFRDANAEMMAAFKAGDLQLIQETFDKIKPQLEKLQTDFKSLTDAISDSFMSAFSGILKGTKTVKEAAMDMLNTVLDKTIELLMAPVFDGIAGFIGKGIFGLTGAMPALPSFDGGGGTGNGARSGGLDGKGGFLSIMHPKETVTDHTRAGGGMGGGGVTINVMVDGATGNGEIMEMVSRGVSTGLKYYDAKVLPQSLKRVSANPRRM